MQSSIRLEENDNQPVQIMGRVSLQTEQRPHHRLMSGGRPVASRDEPGTGPHLFESENHQSTGNAGTPVDRDLDNFGGGINMDTMENVAN